MKYPLYSQVKPFIALFIVGTALFLGGIQTASASTYKQLDNRYLLNASTTVPCAGFGNTPHFNCAIFTATDTSVPAYVQAFYKIASTTVPNQPNITLLDLGTLGQSGPHQLYYNYQLTASDIALATSSTALISGAMTYQAGNTNLEVGQQYILQIRYGNTNDGQTLGNVSNVPYYQINTTNSFENPLIDYTSTSTRVLLNTFTPDGLATTSNPVALSFQYYINVDDANFVWIDTFSTEFQTNIFSLYDMNGDTEFDMISGNGFTFIDQSDGFSRFELNSVANQGIELYTTETVQIGSASGDTQLNLDTSIYGYTEGDVSFTAIFGLNLSGADTFIQANNELFLDFEALRFESTIFTAGAIAVSHYMPCVVNGVARKLLFGS